MRARAKRRIKSMDGHDVRTICTRGGRTLRHALQLAMPLLCLTACSVGGLNSSEQTAVAVANTATVDARARLPTSTSVIDAIRIPTATRAVTSAVQDSATPAPSPTTIVTATSGAATPPAPPAGTVRPAGSVAITTATGAPSGTGRVYTDPQKHFSFTVPSGWQIQQTQVPGITVQFVSDRLQGNVNIIAEDAPNTTLDQYVRTTIANIKRSYPDFVLAPTGVQATTLGGKPAQKYEFSGVQQQTRIRITQVAAISGDIAYIMTFTVRVEDADVFADQANAILMTFTFRE